MNRVSNTVKRPIKRKYRKRLENLAMNIFLPRNLEYVSLIA